MAADPDPAWVSLALARLVREVSSTGPLVGVYLHGSLALQDFQDGRSDVDVVVVLEGAPDRDQVRRLGQLHRQAVLDDARAAAVHCAYVDLTTIADLDRDHLAWAHARVLRRPLSLFARRELLRVGRPVHGPPVESVVPRWAAAAAARAVAADQAYWRRHSYRLWDWGQDVWVDLGLTSAVRELVWSGQERVVSKSEAVSAMPALDVPAWLVADLRRRRAGEAVPLDRRERSRRAWTATREVRRLQRLLRR